LIFSTVTKFHLFEVIIVEPYKKVHTRHRLFNCRRMWITRSCDPISNPS
jgi:hypothetical protein